MKAFVVVVLALGVGSVAAEPNDVPSLIKLVETKPADMDRSSWKEKRRDAARKLGQSKNKAAVPVLIKVADAETFDIIGEIAIEGLGNLGDPSAIPVLQKIAADVGRDQSQRDLAKKALGKLGAGEGTPAPPPDKPPPDHPAPDKPPPPDPGNVLKSTTGSAPAGNGLIDSGKPAELPELPNVPDDALAAYERVTFALGAASASYDTVRERLAFDFDFAGSYARRVERQSMAWGFGADAHVVAGYLNPPGRQQIRGTQVDVDANGEARFYTSAGLYGIGKVVVGTQVSYFNVKDTDPANDDSNTRLDVDVQAALGGGYGRVLDVGGAIRVRRLSRALDAAHALGKPIDAATARTLELTWWALRGERSAYRSLVATVAILRKAGILLTEPDAGLSYEILSVLRDTQLFQRPSGLDLQLVVSEGYLRRPNGDDNPTPPAGEDGRVEQVLASAGYGAQLANDTLELSGTAYGRLRILAPMQQPSPWAVGATARLRKFTYGDHGDPFGMLDLSASVDVSDQDNLDPGNGDDLGMRISGQVGFTWWLNQASGIRLAGTIATESKELFFGVSLSAAYGLLDGTFSGL